MLQFGEGFDDARLDTLFLAMPISWKGTLQQYVGRLHRLHDNKHIVQVYDYIDNGVPMLARMYERRLRGYSAIGYAIEQEVELPPPLRFSHSQRNRFRDTSSCSSCDSSSFYQSMNLATGRNADELLPR